MKARTTIAASLFRAVIGIFFVIMTMAFIAVPYSLSRHPGDPLPQPSSVESRHLS